MLYHFGFANLEELWFRFDLRAGAGTARIANGNRTRIVICHRPKHVDELVFVLRLHVHPIRNVPQITDVEQAVMRRSVVTAQSGAVHAEPDVQFLNGHVVNGHVVSALEKCGVDREKRRQSLRRDATGEKRRVFFRNSDIKVARRMRFREMR